MIKKIYIYWFLTVTTLLFSSCSEDLDDSIKYLNKIVETSESGTEKTTTFFYNQAQLVRIESAETIKVFTYTADLITKIETTTLSNNSKTIVNYSYNNGKLQTVQSDGDYVINYTHNQDGTVSYEKFDISLLPLPVKIHHGKLYFDNGNIIREERTLDNVGVGVLSRYYVNYEYDLKSNPLHHILGYEKLLDHEGIISTNNYLISTVETSVEKDGQIISSASFYKNTFKYDKRNYPVEKNSLVSIPHKGISYNLKTTYHY
ncbi:hypothetical protein [Flavobacterium sp. UMI-01]|uniref:hypothetical protein n=1 Tax=Flavobacterium sp. UMI-01 TaxID=1441053 RepID=UPI001C7D7B28|nr:hypothetical protein [Flavobacterium sp. UMI-01]GIZ07518.1 hypothetical protein FUMI01_02450 [Flavobacterium sp. UMI-01]